MDEKHSLKIYGKPELRASSLVVGWIGDAGELGLRVVEYLNKKLGGKVFGEIEPAEFFPLGGVSIENDVAQFPETKFYYCQKGLVILKSYPPRSGWYKFIQSVLDVGESCQVNELYILGGMVTLSAHTAPRQLSTIASSPEMKEILKQYGIAGNMDYESPPGQRPTLNSYFLWAAKRRNINAASLWVPIPFYLVAAEDPQSWKKVIKFLDKRLHLEIDFSDLDEEVTRQNERITQLRNLFPEVDDSIRRLENRLSITEKESQKLINELEKFFRKRD